MFRYFFGPEKPPPPPIDPKPWDGFHRLVEVPDGTTHIPRVAFYSKACLQEVTLPSSLVYVGSSSFANCSGLRSITIPDGCSVGKYAFQHCDIRSIVLPAGLKEIRSGTFCGCYRLRKIRLPASLERIQQSAFLWCARVPNNQSRAFHITRLSLLLNTNALDSRCHDLNHIRLPDGLISIGRSAFSYNSSLASITFPASLTLIEHSAFSSCSALKQVVVPTTTEIADRAFHPCTRIVRLPPARMRARQNWHAAVDAALAYKRCRAQLYGWLERAQNRLGAYGPDGAARKRDREEFERDRLLSPFTRASSSEEHAGQGSLLRAAGGLVPRPSVRFAAGLDVVIRNELRGAADSLGVEPLRRECRPSRTVHPRLRAYARWVGP